MEKWGVYNVNLGEGVANEQSYSRPCIALMIDEALGICIEIPLTSNLDASRFSNTIRLPKDDKNNLRDESVAMLFHVRSISVRRISVRPIGMINEPQREKIKEGLRFMLDI